jgi:hypothetical protein
VDEGAPKLRAGWAHAASKGVASYRGVLRDREEPVWQTPRTFLVPGLAQQAAEAELARREQGAREVVHALHCGPCAAWYDPRASSPADLEALAAGKCPRCGVLVSREKIIILEREPVGG